MTRKLSILSMLFMIVVVLIVVSCGERGAAISTNQDEDIDFNHSMKGWQLFGWQAGGEEYFTLIAGTNRLKTVEEVTSDENIIIEGNWFKVKVQGRATIKDLLLKLPEGDEMLWMGAPQGFSPLSAETIDEIKQYCESHGIDW